MRISPRSLVLASAVLVSAAFTIQTAAAETVRVPFNFKVNGKPMPAGTYQVQRNGLNSFVSLEGPAANQSYMWTLAPGDAAPASSEVKVTFAKYGSDYELRQIQYHSQITHRLDTRKAKAEAERTLRGE